MTRGPRRRQVVVQAHAKINLDLRVLGSRPDGFHELRTVFQALALHDVVTCEARQGPLAIECRAARVPLDQRNLAWKAASALWLAMRRRGEPSGVVIRINKRIPLEAGLGGGSADAAATLLALTALWRVTPTQQRVLPDVAASLGADVAFFLSGGTALGLGRGDEIYPLADLPRHWIVLLVPEFGVSTADAYRWWDADQHTVPPVRRSPGQRLFGPWSPRASWVTNDLEGSVVRRHPEIRRMTKALQRAGALVAAMTGSGSTVFGLFRRRPDAERAAQQLESRPWRAVVTRTLGRAEYGRLTHPRIRGA